MAPPTTASPSSPVDRRPADPQWFGNDHPSLRHAWHPVARVADLGAGPLATELLGERLVVVRLGDDVVVLPDECPHRLAPLSAGEIVRTASGACELRCAYHGFRFGADGRCTAVPALGDGAPVPPKAHLAPVRTKLHQGVVWAALDEPLTDVLDVAEHDDAGFVPVPLPPIDWTAGAAQMVDNFLDVAHFPFTHVGTFGDPDDTEVEEYAVRRTGDGWGFEVEHRHLARALSGSGALIHRIQAFTYRAPLTVLLRITYVEEDAVLSIVFRHQPLDAGRTRLWITDYRNDIDESGIAAAAAFQVAVGNEDRALLERFPRKSIPLAPTAEVHTRADRITLELRRVLAEFVEAAATGTGTGSRNGTR